ncbi:hypothetical protein LAJ19_20285 (plasmid) [Deinococcus taeanensis]|uniref:hypothetical protein n=1 Tax=Deinococcus taeanensis TaxID=2737050 RepID=UPI001CDBA41A|nr:hypothetical protein [Deinococcus taeanensis]UBV45466.1 hypothetical protein LAJ19_20285 [Deinococcus taeanensis]
MTFTSADDAVLPLLTSEAFADSGLWSFLNDAASAPLTERLVQALTRCGIDVCPGAAAPVMGFDLFGSSPADAPPEHPSREDALHAAATYAARRARDQRLRAVGPVGDQQGLPYWLSDTRNPEDAVLCWLAHLADLDDRCAHLRAHNEPWGGANSLFVTPMQETCIEDVERTLQVMGLQTSIPALVQRQTSVCLLSEHADLLVCDLYGQMVLRTGNELRVLPGPGYALLTSHAVDHATLFALPQAQWAPDDLDARTLTWHRMRGHWPEWAVPGWWVAAPTAHSEALVRHQGDPFGPFLRCPAPPEGWPAS